MSKFVEEDQIVIECLNITNMIKKEWKKPNKYLWEIRKGTKKEEDIHKEKI